MCYDHLVGLSTAEMSLRARCGGSQLIVGLRRQRQENHKRAVLHSKSEASADMRCPLSLKKKQKLKDMSAGLFTEITLNLQITLGRNVSHAESSRPGTRPICSLLKPSLISVDNTLQFPSSPYSNVKDKRLKS